MYITSPDPIFKTVEEYDFSFTNGMMMPVIIDKDAGDTVDVDTYPHAIVIRLAEKPSLADPTKKLPAEEITLFTSHILSIQKRLREVEELTHEQKEQWRITVQELSKTVQ